MIKYLIVLSGVYLNQLEVFFGDNKVPVLFYYADTATREEKKKSCKDRQYSCVASSHSTLSWGGGRLSSLAVYNIQVSWSPYLEPHCPTVATPTVLDLLHY